MTYFIPDVIHAHFNMVENTCVFNYTGHPSLTLTAGHLEGMPVGVMLVSKMFAEATLLNVAHALEQALKL